MDELGTIAAMPIDRRFLAEPIRNLAPCSVNEKVCLGETVKNRLEKADKHACGSCCSVFARYARGGVL